MNVNFPRVSRDTRSSPHLPGVATAGGRTRSLRRLAGAVAGGLAILVAAAVLLVPVLAAALRSGTGTGATAAGKPFAAEGLRMTVPADWTIVQPMLVLHYQTVIAYMGTGKGTMTCGPDYIPGLGGTCTESIDLGASGLVIKVTSWDGPPKPDGWVGELLKSNRKASAVNVGGAPAAYEDVTAQEPASSGADQVVQWTITRPGVQYGAYMITAYMKGTDLAATRGAVDAVVKSISVGP